LGCTDRSNVYIITKGKTKLSSFEGFQLPSIPPSGNSRLERRQRVEKDRKVNSSSPFFIIFFKDEF
jgi:hypothetical protein